MTAPASAPAYRIDGELVSREAFYAAACDPRRSVVIEACAGAGKTWMLVSRIVRALLDGSRPEQILAITFTRKAAGEMRARLAEWLAGFADPACSGGDRVQALRERGLDAEAAEALAPALAGLQQRLFESARPAQIVTFHGWFLRLLRAAPIELLAELGLQAGVETIDDASELHGELMRRFRRALLADPARQADYAALVRDRRRRLTDDWLLAALDKRVEIEAADRAGTLATSVPPAASLSAAWAAFSHPGDCFASGRGAVLVAEVARELLKQTGSAARLAGERLEAALAQADPAARLAAIEHALFTDGRPRVRVDASRLAELQRWATDATDAAAQHTAHLEQGRLVRLTRLLFAQYAALKRERGVADMTDLEQCALRLLRDSSLSAWVQERLDTRLRHVLIDEFQDTSPLQWQALQAWLSGYAGAGGGASGQAPPGVFIVGDPKQSIYRFRRAEPRVFAAASDFLRESLGGAVLACDHTRRNAPEVIDAVNQVFEAAQAQGDFAGFRAHSTEQPPLNSQAVFALPEAPRPPREAPTTNGAAVPVWRDSLTTQRTEAETLLRRFEADAVADAVDELIHGQGVGAAPFRPNQIMVLARRHAPLRLMAEALQAKHLPYAVSEGLSVAASPEARDLIALLDVLASPGHALSLAHALRSPLFGVDDDDLMALVARSRATGQSAWDSLVGQGDGEEGSAETDWPMSPALERARRLLSIWQPAARALPVHDLLDRIVAEGDLKARVLAAVPPERRLAAEAAIDAMLALSLELDGGRRATPYAFVRALKRGQHRIPAPAGADAVQLLTVHGAKGLEADVVFVIDADPEPRAADRGSVIVDWPVHAPAPRCCAFVAAEAHPPPSLRALIAAEHAARRREELNGLYVAMTRSRSRLVFSRTVPYRAEPGLSAWQRVRSIAADWRPAPRRQDASTAPATMNDRLVVTRELPRWRTEASDAVPAAPASFGAHTAAALGQAVHRLMQWLPGSLADGAALQQAAIAATREFGLPAQAAQGVAAFANAIVANPVCAALLRTTALRWAGNEVDIAVDDEVRRIDRLVQLRDGTWWVIDYKLAATPQHDPALIAQLRAYRDAVAALQPGQPVRAGFITGAGTFVELGSSMQITTPDALAAAASPATAK